MDFEKINAQRGDPEFQKAFIDKDRSMLIEWITSCIMGNCTTDSTDSTKRPFFFAIRGICGAFPLLLLVNTVSLIAGDISGLVLDSEYKPMADVRICTASWLCVKSNENGNYEIDRTARGGFIRFDKTGYAPATKRIHGDRVNAVLARDDQNKSIWNAPKCSIENNHSASIGKYSVRMKVPREMGIQKIGGGDYELTMISKSDRSNSNRMSYWEGASVSNGLPSWNNELSIIHDKNVICDPCPNRNDENIPRMIIDLKAQSANKRFWRFIGSAFEFVTYENVTEESSKEYDAIIDSLCIIP